MLPKKARIPAPFQRPAIEIGGHGRVWQEIPARLIQGNDVIPGLGRVYTVEAIIASNVVEAVRVGNEADEYQLYRAEGIVRVFGPPRADNTDDKEGVTL